MVRAIMHGCNGHMGQVITGLIKADEGIELVAGIDKYTGIANDYPVFESLEKCDVEADVIIDFSNAAAADALLTYCEEKKMPVVLCTTGLSEEQLAKIPEAAKKTAVLKSANMSLGINLPKFLHRQDMIWRLLKSITTRSWTHRAEQQLRLRIL